MNSLNELNREPETIWVHQYPSLISAYWRGHLVFQANGPDRNRLFVEWSGYAASEGFRLEFNNKRAA